MYTLEDISRSPATVGGTESNNILLELHSDSGSYKDYIHYNNSHWDVRELAELFINNHAAVDSSYDRMYSPTPAGVFRIGPFEGLLYSNGAVLVGKDNNEFVLVELWVEPDTARLFMYPDPKSVEKTNGS